jgi:UDP-4-amino-4,6-dideoxy-N-acetyl-beta-L-altrosamine N-acetyltransferase
MKLSDGRVRLITEDDLPMVLAWRNSERIRNSSFGDHIISMQEHRNWFKSLDNHKKVGLIFELYGKPAGAVNFSGIDRHDNKCSWGFYLGEPGLPKGSGLLMGYHALDYLFNELKIRKLNSQVLAYNEGSIKYHKKLGFVEEGLLVQECLKNGRYEDVVVLAHFQDLWREYRPQVARVIEG